jgi:acyl-CoA thioesterase-1
MTIVKRSVLITSLFLSLFVLNSCGSSESPAATNENKLTEETTSTQATDAPQKKDRPRIVFFGNSLTAGYGLDEQYSFPSLIQQKLDSLGYNYEVVNAGLSGETTAGGLNRIDWVMEQPMDIFVLELGGNDVLRGFDLDVTRKNLAAILDAVRSKYPEIKLVLAGMEAPPNMGDAYTKEFRKIYQDLAREKNIALIPFLLADVGGIESLNLPDRIHPNKEGQEIVANNVMKVLAPLLER